MEKLMVRARYPVEDPTGVPEPPNYLARAYQYHYIYVVKKGTIRSLNDFPPGANRITLFTRRVPITCVNSFPLAHLA